MAGLAGCEPTGYQGTQPEARRLVSIVNAYLVQACLALAHMPLIQRDFGALFHS